ncbi:hypothetical protein SESBI_07865 [Sesbania bispinosa]|nr:hypothetical protein SESBI_07865 [Sesbania bispinosa]
MALTTPKPEKKRLGEFLKEQQEPFILEVYLLEKGCSKKWSSNGDSAKNLKRSASSGLNQKKRAHFPFSKVLTALHKKLAFHNQRSALIRDSNTRDEHVNVSVSVPHEAGSVDQTVVEPDRFSTASSSTVFNSCSDIDEDGISFSSHKDKQSQQATNNGKQRQRYIGVSVTHETLDKDVSVWGIEQRIRSCGVLVPKKITEDSLLSAALWSSLIKSAKRKELQGLIGTNVLKSRRVLHKTKQLLFDCMREITISHIPRKDDDEDSWKQFMGPERLGKVIWERTKEWGQVAANETNLSYLLSLDYLESLNEWSEFKPQVKGICVEIADAILEGVKDEIVSEMIEILSATT